MSGVVALDHLQLAMPAGREAEARAFYGGILGLPEIGKPANLAVRGGVWFALGTQQLHLGVEGDFRPAKKAHPAFLVRDLGGLRARLEQAGFAPYEDEPLSGYDRFYIADPFGDALPGLFSIPSLIRLSAEEVSCLLKCSFWSISRSKWR
jgi:catechol 2,3-dioxygenase-like lactoylglutathione lyase family enzyme